MLTSWETWLQWHKEEQYTILPYIKRVEIDWSQQSYVPSWGRVWQDASPHAFVLESGKVGRYTYLGISPESIIYGTDEIAHTISYYNPDEQTQNREEICGKPLEVVREWMKPYKSPYVANGPKFSGGCVGFWGYDVIRSIEKLPRLAKRDIEVPDYLFMRMNEVWVLDHQERCVYCVVHRPISDDMGEAELLQTYESAAGHAEGMADYWLTWFEGEQQRAQDEAERERRLAHIEQQSLHIDVESITEIYSPFAKQEFIQAVEKIQDYIAQGDVFQVNLSQRQSRAVQSTAEELYEWLRLFNPSPYMGYISTPHFQIVSASPELLVEQYGGKLATRPIAGTRRRGRTVEEEALFAEELMNNEKEKAEHIMLVDLERNDLGRVSAYGTIKVEELMVIERYSHVMHLVSQIEGELATGKDCFDVIAATFPGGTITGAPKIRTMEIIEELEPVTRGPYTGSMGWIDYNGDMEFNIIIRTMVIEQDEVHIQAGAGIVIDSDAEREYVESLSKAKALWKAIQYAETFPLFRRDHAD
ncbi:MAG TPA: anthranilate synthase component I family protein [Candidatus Paenibacillus intestinavium]|nr:anthranilate synthase component I family protein [Candidatus Paenibacillus intestinavium]